MVDYSQRRLFNIRQQNILTQTPPQIQICLKVLGGNSLVPIDREDIKFDPETYANILEMSVHTLFQHVSHIDVKSI